MTDLLYSSLILLLISIEYDPLEERVGNLQNKSNSENPNINPSKFGTLKLIEFNIINSSLPC
jgi:hypothetical protein